MTEACIMKDMLRDRLAEQACKLSYVSGQLVNKVWRGVNLLLRLADEQQ